MSNRDKLTGQMNSLKNTLNDFARESGIEQIVKNFEASVNHKHKTTGSIEGGFKTIVSTVTDVVNGVKESKPPENNDLSVLQLDRTANNKTVKVASSGTKSDMQSITNQLELVADGFLDVIISSPTPEAIATVLNTHVPAITKDEVKSTTKSNVDQFAHDDENVDKVINNVYQIQNSMDKLAETTVANISNTSLNLQKKTSMGFDTTIEDLIEKTFRAAEVKLSPALYKNGVANNLPATELKKIIQYQKNGRWEKAASILSKYSDKNSDELASIVKTINNKASENITEKNTTITNLPVERTDILKNLWREENTPTNSTVLKPIIGTEITSEVINLEREVTEVIIMFLPKKNATVEEYHSLYIEEYNHGINQHFYIGFDAVTYRGRPIEIEAKKTKTITNNHYKNSILIGINVDETAMDRKVKPEQAEKLVELLDQIIQAKPGIQIFNARDVGWLYNVNTEALDIPGLIKNRLNKINAPGYDPQSSDPLDQETLSTLGA